MWLSYSEFLEVNQPLYKLIVHRSLTNIQLKQKDLIGRNYDAIPYEFYKLKEPLSLNPAQTLNTIIPWFNGSYREFTYTGAQLLKIIFPDFPESFENELIELIQMAEEEHVLIVMAILRNYKGASFLHNTCKALIKALPASSEWLTEIAIILDSTGVVSGEFGFVEAYERKKQTLTKWLEDSDNRIQKFAESYIANLDKKISSETRRAEEEIELRKHLYSTGE